MRNEKAKTKGKERRVIRHKTDMVEEGMERDMGIERIRNKSGDGGRWEMKIGGKNTREQ